MPRYLVQRTFPDGLQIPMDDIGTKTVLGVVEANAALGVTWLQSYVSQDKTVTYCIYDGPTPGSIREAAKCNGLPVDQVTAVGPAMETHPLFPQRVNVNVASLEEGARSMVEAGTNPSAPVSLRRMNRPDRVTPEILPSKVAPILVDRNCASSRSTLSACRRVAAA